MAIGSEKAILGSSLGYCVSGTVLHTSDGSGGYTGTGYVPGCYMKFNLCVNTMYWVFDDRKKIIKSKICIWLWLNFFVFYTFLCDAWFGHFEWFLIFPTVLHTFDGGSKLKIQIIIW